MSIAPNGATAVRKAWKLAILAAAVLTTAWLGGAQSGNQAEVSVREGGNSTFTIRAGRNLVLARVVVRDSHGQLVKGLHKEDFRLLDNKQPQTITDFAEEAGGAAAPAVSPEGASTPGPSTATAPASPGAPQRFVALFFDDIHLEFPDLVPLRAAARRYLDSLGPGDRAGIYTTSTGDIQEFTSDRSRLDRALDQLRPRPVGGSRTRSCPDLSDYEAYLVVEQHDDDAINIATQETIQCLCQGDTQHCPNPQDYAERQALGILNNSEQDARTSLQGLEQLVRRMVTVPGQRSIVMISPGFLTRTLSYDLSHLIDRALRSNVVIGALDSQGLRVDLPLGDASESSQVITQVGGLIGRLSQFRTAGHDADLDPLAEIAVGTGGTFFHNSNDFDLGFREAGALPEDYYLLAYTPRNLKFDGRFHKITVELATANGFSLQARKGYYAPKEPPTAEEQAADEIRELTYSQQQLGEIPVSLRLQFFKPDSASAKLSVFAHIDLHAARFRKENGRNVDNLTLVTVVFDDSGNFVAGVQKTLELRVTDAHLPGFLEHGVELRTAFDVKTGAYTVREVVSDAQTARLAALNQNIDIP